MAAHRPRIGLDRPPRRHRLHLEHAEPAARSRFVLLFNLFAFPLTNGLLPYVAREIYHVDQTGLRLHDREHRTRRHALRRLMGQSKSTSSRGDDRRRHRLASAADRFCTDDVPSRRHRRAVHGRHRAKPRHGRHDGHAGAQGQSALSWPRRGRADAGDLHAAARAADRRRADRTHRLHGDRHAPTPAPGLVAAIAIVLRWRTALGRAEESPWPSFSAHSCNAYKIGDAAPI